MGSQPMPHYDVRNMPGTHLEYQPKPIDNYAPPPTQPPPSQINIVHRLSGIIKSQLPFLQQIMIYADKKTKEERVKKDRSRSRSRDRVVRRTSKEREHREWNCPRCAFLNFDFRDMCKRCNEPKAGNPRSERFESSTNPGGRNYQPLPDDWRCNKCSNINYARRTECHRCHTPRSK
jgi:hypothetical protein